MGIFYKKYKIIIASNKHTHPMGSLLKFNRLYFALATALFVIEILIAAFVHDQIIRPWLGDVLVVMLIYCFVKSFLDIPVFKTALSVLIFSFLIETLQYFKIVNLLGLQHSRIASIVVGTTFEWTDLVAYTLGFVCILYFEKRYGDKNINPGIKAS